MLPWLQYADDVMLRSLFNDMWFREGFAGVIKAFTVSVEH